MSGRFARISVFMAATALVIGPLSPLRADEQPPTVNPRDLYEKVTPSLVAVQYTFTGETVQQDVIVPGIVVNDQGLVMIPLAAVSDALPDEQLKKFKIIIPRKDVDNEEVEAEFEGRDERCGMAFVKAKPAESDKAKHSWTPIHFESAPSQVGDSVYSVGMLGKTGGYHSILRARWSLQICVAL